MSKEKVRQLRKNQTDAENRLWQHLRGRRLHGYKFRRQYPLGGYIADFACFAELLIVELDGYHHADAEQQAYDKERTKAFEAGGFRVLRFWNEQVQNEMDNVLEHITHALVLRHDSPLSLRERAGVRENSLCKH